MSLQLTIQAIAARDKEKSKCKLLKIKAIFFKGTHKTNNNWQQFTYNVMTTNLQYLHFCVSLYTTTGLNKVKKIVSQLLTVLKWK